MLSDFPQAVLVLADGTAFTGISVGAAGSAVGEVVFNTALTGYQEILTDPSYAQQIVTLTYPHIGNVGSNDEDAESDRIHAAGLVIRDMSPLASNFRGQTSLAQYLGHHGTVAIAEVDTRALTRHLRTHGVQNGCVLGLEPGQSVTPELIQQALGQAQGAPSMAGANLAQVVSTTQPYAWDQGEWQLGLGFDTPASSRFHVVAIDLGAKRNILRMLAQRGCRVTVLPANSTVDDVWAQQPNGVFLSNGPGDPEPCHAAIEVAKSAMAKRIPLFGICLGHQIMALASGASTYKMKFGHHGANHPVQELATGRVGITSQNHGFAVNAQGMPAHLRVTHVSLFDQSVQGVARTDVPAIGFQGHPEASPGPHDVGYVFDHFVAMMEAA